MRSKIIRAEPIASLYERGKVWHATSFPALEEQMCSYAPGVGTKSPDRLDALVWALTELMLTVSPKPKVWG
jgi:phage terminase large subunit-like protein